MAAESGLNGAYFTKNGGLELGPGCSTRGQLQHGRSFASRNHGICTSLYVRCCS